MQRLYERYLRAESFRKALVYQKRYLLLLLGGFQECEQATLCLIAHMGARPAPPVARNRPLGRFRAAVRVVIAVSRVCTAPDPEPSGGTSQDPERSLTEYIQHLEKVQQRLVGVRPGERHQGDGR
ncbi:Pericentrin [Liparis tanakae]|uniref:Pericentrin n=1 Tax=Liparis tanakae TaxID=230148 RepID=A0A4Z2E4U0_9TELE|nr:Pericentrin [Liparis tanakae]